MADTPVESLFPGFPPPDRGNIRDHIAGLGLAIGPKLLENYLDTPWTEGAFKATGLSP